MKRRKDTGAGFEDSLSDDWSRDIKIAEVPIGNQPLRYLGLGILIVALAVIGQVAYLNFTHGAYYSARAADNVGQANETSAPRGEILDKEGNVLAEDQAAFAALLNARAFVNGGAALQSSTIAAVASVLGISPDNFASRVAQASAENFATPIVLQDDLTPTELVNLQALNLPTIELQSEFAREYPNGQVFSSVVGYTGRVSQADLQADPSLSAADFVGKAGVEAYYDSTLRGIPGVTLEYKNAQGQTLGQAQMSNPSVGAPLQLTIDGGLQTELYDTLANGLASLNRTVGLGIAIDPQNGQVLALVNLPSYNNNIFSSPGASSSAAEIQQLLTSPDKPLFNRAISGNYNPGSTIKPLDAVAGLKEGVIDPSREVFSPGYLLVPNPYNSSTPTKYLDWQYQGHVDLASALAQSSDVYFYLVGGGSPVSTPMLNDPTTMALQASASPSSISGGRPSAWASRLASICLASRLDSCRRRRGNNPKWGRRGSSATPTMFRSARGICSCHPSSF